MSSSSPVSGSCRVSIISASPSTRTTSRRRSRAPKAGICASRILLRLLVLCEPRRQRALRQRLHGRVVDVGARPKTRLSRRMLFAATLGLAAIAAGVASQLGLGGSDKVQIGDGTVSALARAAGPGDALPASVLGYPFAARNFASPSGGGARLLTTRDSLRLYAVPGKGGMLCLIEVDVAADAAGGACA